MKPTLFPGAVAFATALFGVTELASAQIFVNMDFEDATIPPTPVGGHTSPASAAQCFPGWTVGGAQTTVAYNDISLGGPVISLMGPDFPNFVNYTPLQGNYSVYMQYFNDFSPPTLSQTGLIPAGTQSLNFLCDDADTAVVTLNGINVPLAPIAGGRLSGNIPAGLAGTVATLTFTTATGAPGFAENYYFDNVQFSIVPEPSEFALFALGAVSLTFRHWRKSPR